MFRWIVILAMYTAMSQGRSLRDIDEVRSQLSSFPSGTRLWEPSDGQSREDWLRCHGQPDDVCRRTREKLAALKKLITDDMPHGADQPPSLHPTPVSAASTTHSMDVGQDATSPRDDTLDGCIWLTEEQIDAMMLSLNSNETATDETEVHSRQKRTLTDFRRSPFSKWSMPITYKFDGSHSVYQMKTVRDAFSHWAENTCIRFKEVPTDQDVTSNHLLITSGSGGCYSYIGQISYVPQQLNLQHSCISQFGIPVHEIGHALGMWHEQMRNDRDESIQINWDNVFSAYRSQYTKVDTHNLVQYNYGSVMQYGPRGGSSTNGKETMTAVNRLYQGNMGQRTGLSFENIKTINMAYCADKCVHAMSLSRPCQHGGYQDPNNCDRCLCPDGFAGQFCESVAPSTNADCGGVITLTSGGSYTIKSPGYDNDRYYLSYQGCNWWIKAPKDHVVKMQFVGDFGVYCVQGSCFHWVEAKYKADLGLEGARFCCFERPTETLTSESNEMMIIFKSNYSYDYLVNQRGFHAVLTAVCKLPNATDKRRVEASVRLGFCRDAISVQRNVVRNVNGPLPGTALNVHHLRVGSSSSSGENQETTTTTTVQTTTTTPATATISNDCRRRDLTLVLDSSDSVTGADWSRLMSFVGHLVSDLRRRDVLSRVGVVAYTQRARIAMTLDHHDANELASLPFISGHGRNISGALRLTRTSVLNSASSSSTCLLVTTAGATVDRHQTLSESDAARRNRVGIVVLGVGPLVNGSEATAIATHDDNGVLYADSFQHLLDSNADFTQLLADKICESGSSSAGQGTSSSTSLWSCSFEQSSNPLCGMTQEQSRDQFDWTVHRGSTPSRPTGPDFAHHGDFYAFIEASDPRRPNDEAWLLLPKMDHRGVVCVDFYYHMFGFHVRSLRLVHRSPNSAGSEVSRTTWLRSRDMGNVWYHGNSQVDISPNSQLIFVATRGDAYSGDIAIDNLNIRTGSCR